MNASYSDLPVSGEYFLYSLNSKFDLEDSDIADGTHTAMINHNESLNVR